MLPMRTPRQLVKRKDDSPKTCTADKILIVEHSGKVLIVGAVIGGL
jgi:hypothetical protein